MKKAQRVTLFIAQAGLLTTALLAWTGCNSQLTGNEGNLTFQYAADDDVNNFNKPVAVGAKLDVKVLEVGNNRSATLTAASTSDPNVLDVASFAGDTMVLEGKGAGNTLVEVAATTSGGTAVTDSVNMSAAVPDVLKLRHTCTEGDRALYLVGQELAFIGFDMERSNGQPVIGYGYYPVSAEPAEGATVITEGHKDQIFIRLSLSDTKGDVTLKSDIDTATLSMGLVQEGDIDGIDINENSPAFQILVGNVNYPHFWPTVGGTRICQGALGSSLTAETSTPDICDVRAVGDDQPESGYVGESQFVRIEGKAFGTCEFTVTFAGANGGQGLTESFTASIGDFPDDNDGQSGEEDTTGGDSTASTGG
ncbi:MAG: hypothetical protein CMH57_15995 [Myxococcales bacterium]|nr:hypothetical protein [Myxococcales bacterium]